MSAPAIDTVTDIEPPTPDALESLDSSRHGTTAEPGRRAWRRLEEIEDERRLRDELADWEDFAVDDSRGPRRAQEASE